VDYTLEVVVVPVSDIERAKHFYSEQMGFVVDVDHQPNDEFRVVQMTPPGSGCSVTIGKPMCAGANTSARHTPPSAHTDV